MRVSECNIRGGGEGVGTVGGGEGDNDGGHEGEVVRVRQ